MSYIYYILLLLVLLSIEIVLITGFSIIQKSVKNSANKMDCMEDHLRKLVSSSSRIERLLIGIDDSIK